MRDYLKLAYLFSKDLIRGVDFPFALSVDTTHRCNLHCQHCYFQEQNYRSELPVSELLMKIKEIKKQYPSIVHASWVGGEPLLRQEIIEKSRKLFPFNMIVTNGTIELPKWKNCVFNVSVDGTKEYFEKIRKKNIYETVKRHANRDDVKVNIACVINKLNYGCLEELLAEWSKTKVIGVIFDFYTPIKGIEEDLWLPWKLRDGIIDKLIDLKKKFGNFILNTEQVLKLMKSGESSRITTQCILPEAVICLDPLGKRKLPCVIGEKADCERCGCVIPFLIESFVVRKEIKSIMAAIKTLT